MNNLDSINLEGIRLLYDNYPMSFNKKKLIIALFIKNHFCGNKPDDVILRNELNKFISKILGIHKNINNLTLNDYSIIDILKNTTLINKDQIDFMKSNGIDKQKIIKILNKDKNYEDITNHEFENIIRNPNISMFKIVKGNNPIKNFIVTKYSTDYEIGYTFLTNTTRDSLIKYIKFYDLLIFDYDLNSENNDKLVLLNKIKENLPHKYSYKIYETYNGYHVFFMSFPCLHNSDKTINFSYKVGSDPWYITYSKFFGYSIRISPKKNRNEEYVHKFICDYGDGIMHEKCKNMINIMEKTILEPIELDTDNICLDTYKKIKPLNDLDTYDNPYSRFLKKTCIISINNMEKHRVNYISDFCNYIVELYGKNFEIIEILNKFFKNNLMKPHRFIHYENDYFIALDLIVNMYCIYYSKLMVIDIDYNDSLKNINDIILMVKNKQKVTKDSYIIYSTTNGAHVFVTNRKFKHSSEETIEYMLNFNADFTHIMMTYNIGWCIRLNKKKIDEKMYQFVEEIGNDYTYRGLVDAHIYFCNIFWNNLVNTFDHKE